MPSLISPTCKERYERNDQLVTDDLYLDLNLSWLAQYSCQMSLNRNMWKTRTRKAMENQKIAGSPPSLLP